MKLAIYEAEIKFQTVMNLDHSAFHSSLTVTVLCFLLGVDINQLARRS